jgi:hypothetical protein
MNQVCKLPIRANLKNAWQLFWWFEWFDGLNSFGLNPYKLTNQMLARLTNSTDTPTHQPKLPQTSRNPTTR